MTMVPFVDTYIHFIDLSNPKLRYFWLEPDARTRGWEMTWSGSRVKITWWTNTLMRAVTPTC